MSAGIQPTKAELDTQAGDILRRLNLVMIDIKSMKAFLDRFTSADLVSLHGYTTAEADTIKSAFTDAAQLETIYAGAATLAAAKDFRTFAQRLWGFGF